ncbi:hypothetical protein NDU88_002476 [Pleurodeles waltl]|uniref:Uncharacterized protein n=1 Tax=Pleurodeles waltl TaxID=8319 RepID=A0AAV7UAP4_PLEWA|nr:hypothetical protein NDU88_002476 [Pleurodeles waltl]
MGVRPKKWTSKRKHKERHSRLSGKSQEQRSEGGVDSLLPLELESDGVGGGAALLLETEEDTGQQAMEDEVSSDVTGPTQASVMMLERSNK